MDNPLGSWGGSPVSAVWGQRTAFTFDFTWAEFRVEASGAAPGSSIRIDINLDRGPYPGGPLSPIGTASFFTTADGSGNIDFSAEIPNVAGSETAVSGDAAVYQLF